MSPEDLVRLRKAMGLTQEAAADLTGLTAQAVYRAERGKETPTTRVYAAWLKERYGRVQAEAELAKLRG